MLARVQAAPSGPPPVAVILNRHARGVSPEVLGRLRRLMPPQDLYLSRSVGESDAIAGTVVDRGYRAVLLGGGDGTFVQCLADLRSHARRRNTPLPSVGVLRLGTGNAIAWALEASETSESGLRRDLDRARDLGRHTHLPLMEVDGRLTPFAGIGLDAQIQLDFAATTRMLDRLGVGRRLDAGARYAITVAARSTPKYLLASLPKVTVINRGSPAWRVGARGRLQGAPLAAGEVLYEGPCTIATGSTIPYFGLGMKMFPYASLMPNRFQLRCANAPTVEILGNLPAVWRGEYASPNICDFLVDEVELRVERPVPFQIGGDLQQGLRDRIRMAMARPIRVVQ